MTKIILASTSPRRRKLLSKLNLEFEIIPPTFDEKLFDLSADFSSVENLSLKKAQSVAEKIKESALIIGADTIVILDNQILGKPKNREDAFLMLKSLSGKTHIVITGIGICDTATKKAYKGHDITYVTFNELSSSQIYSYIDDRKPFDKAGAYGIQELPKEFIKEVSGETDNVIGLPTKILIKMLDKINNR